MLIAGWFLLMSLGFSFLIALELAKILKNYVQAGVYLRFMSLVGICLSIADLAWSVVFSLALARSWPATWLIPLFGYSIALVVLSCLWMLLLPRSVGGLVPITNRVSDSAPPVRRS